MLETVKKDCLSGIAWLTRAFELDRDQAERDPDPGIFGIDVLKGVVPTQIQAGELGAAGQIIQLIGLGQRLEPSCCAVDHHLGTILARGNPNDKLI